MASTGDVTRSAPDLWPLLERFPLLQQLPRVPLRTAVTPVEFVDTPSGRLSVKRDDLTSSIMGGNKVRSLEFLLAGVGPGYRVTTVGARGSTHALATVIFGKAMGAEVGVGLWPQETNPVARRVESELLARADVTRKFWNPAFALAWKWWRARRGDRVIPAGGTSPLGILGHVNAALELAQQIDDGVLQAPEQVVVPLGSGGTAAGLSLGFAIAGLQTQIIAARVVPKLLGRAGRVGRLARATRTFIEREADVRIGVRIPRVVVVDDSYGGAYGRPTAGASEAAAKLESTAGISLDATYSAKAFASALGVAGGRSTLFWLTFDSRWLSTNSK